jgi:hypothetical protein
MRLRLGVTPIACVFVSRLIELGAAKMLAVCCASLATKASLLDKGCSTASGVSLGSATPMDWSSCRVIVGDSSVSPSSLVVSGVSIGAGTSTPTTSVCASCHFLYHRLEYYKLDCGKEGQARELRAWNANIGDSPSNIVALLCSTPSTKACINSSTTGSCSSLDTM